MVQEDDKLQLPMICNVGKEAWKTKEAKLSAEDAPDLGDPASRGILLEALTAETLMTAGANIVVLRHPETVTLIRKLIQDLS